MVDIFRGGRLASAAAVTLFWAGSETDYSGMIGDHGDYFKMLNALMDNLADIADAIPAAK